MPVTEIPTQHEARHDLTVQKFIVGEVVDRATGEMLWSFMLPRPTWQSPVVVDDVFIMGDCAGVLHGYDLRERTNAACREAGFEPLVAVEGGEMSAVLRFVEAGLGHAVVPQMVVATRPQLAVARLVSPTLTRTIGVSHRAEEAMSLAARAFRDELVRALG